MHTQERSKQRKEQRDRAKRLKQSLEDEEVDRVATESEHIVNVPSSSSCDPSNNAPAVISDHDLSESENASSILSSSECLQVTDDNDKLGHYPVLTNSYEDNDSNINASDEALPQMRDNLGFHPNDEDMPHFDLNNSDSSESDSPAINEVISDFDLTELYTLLDEIAEAEAKPDASLVKKLATWALKNNIVHNHVDGLLQILQTEGHPKIPGTCKTLLKTTKNIKDQIRPLGTGAFWYQGILKGLEPFLLMDLLSGDNVVIDVFVDGASPYKSVKVSLWPIVGSVVGSESPFLFIIAVWCGSSKDPQNLHEYLKDFVAEAKDMMTGFGWNGRKLVLRIRFYIADAPARAFLKNVKAHNSYGSCERCVVYGQWRGRVVFPAKASADLRTDLSFSSRSHAIYHKEGESPLEELGTGMISQFPLDGMHLLYLGVMKKLLSILCKEDKPSSHKLSDENKSQLSSHLLSYVKYCPSEFSRKRRSLDNWKLLKAHELRRLLLYDGILLYAELPTILMNNFLLLHCAIRILSDQSMRNYFEDADYLLKKFVEHAATHDVYGPSFLVYNIHHLEHFAQDCIQHGPIEDFSAFKFENFIGVLKNMLHAPGRTLPQIVARVLERARQPSQPSPRPPAVEVHGLHSSGPFCDLDGQRFKKLCIKGVALTLSTNDSCCLMQSGEIVEILNFVKTRDDQIWIVGNPYFSKEDMYTYPMQSSLLGIFKVCRLLAQKKWKVQDLKQKFYRLPILKNNLETGSFLCIPMLQSLEG